MKNLLRSVGDVVAGWRKSHRCGRLRWYRPLVVSTVLLGTWACAGPASATQVIVGGKLGWTQTDLVGSNDGSLGAKNNFVIGVIWDWQINPWFAVHSGIEATQKGAYVDTFAPGGFASSVKMTYIEFPVLAKFKYPQSPDIRGGFFGVVGPSFAVNTHTSAEYAGASTNIEQETNAFDLGITVGAGYDLPAGPGITTFDVRYVIGLLDVFKSSAPQQDVTGDLKNRSLQITIGYVQAIF